MKALRYTLLGDGSSDRLLDHPIRWALASLAVPVDLGQWADLRHVRPRPSGLGERARRAIELYPAELLLVHRDAEARSLEHGLSEVRDAMAGVATTHVAIVPVRMTEAWLLHDEAAIRRASGNPKGTAALSLPRPSRVEGDADPKETLRAALLDASELSGARRRRKNRDFPSMRARTAELVEDFAPLTGVPAFAAFLSALRAALAHLGYPLEADDEAR